MPEAPKRVKTPNLEVEMQDPLAVIAAKEYDNSTAAAKKPQIGLRFRKMNLPGQIGNVPSDRDIV